MNAYLLKKRLVIAMIITFILNVSSGWHNLQCSEESITTFSFLLRAVESKESLKQAEMIRRFLLDELLKLQEILPKV